MKNILSQVLIKKLRIALLCYFFALCPVNAEEIEIPLPSSSTLKTSFEPHYPYEYLKYENIPDSVTGLDIHLIQSLAKKLHKKIEFKKMLWEETLQSLKSGEIDFAFDASYSKEREEYAYYSKPYRIAEDSLFVLSEKINTYTFKTVSEFLDYVVKSGFRLGVTRGVLYADKHINEFIEDPKNKMHIKIVDSDHDSLTKLLDHEIDGFFTNRIVGASLIWYGKKGKLVSEIYLGMKEKVFLIFSKKTVKKEAVVEFNQAIDELKHSEDYINTISWYLYPVILLQIVNAEWFHILDIMGTLFFSISGVIIAYSKKDTLLAAFIYAILPSIGGGLLRDVIFNQRPVSALNTPIYMLIVCSTIVIGFFVTKIIDSIKRRRLYFKYGSGVTDRIFGHIKFILNVCDALGLSAFTVTGVMIALVAKAEPLWLWGPFFSFVTGAAGTIIRDILSKRTKISEIAGNIYSEIAIFWGLFLSLGLIYNSQDINAEVIQYWVFITVIGAFVTRIGIYLWKVHNVYFK